MSEQTAAALSVMEREVEVSTPEGRCDAVFVHPTEGRHAGVLIWPDAFGLRPAFREMGRRLAAQGHAVLVPNPFYRSLRAPVFQDISHFNFQNPDDRAKLMPLMESLNTAGAAVRDAMAYIGFLDAQPQVDTSRKIGVQGYCLGGPLAVRACAAVPGRVGAGASFHGGGLVTDKPDSPHRLAPQIKARLYFAVASNDEAREPDTKIKLREAFAAAGVAAEIELYPTALHGWCMRDMPEQGGKPVYSRPDAEHAWSKLLALYHDALA